MVRWRRRRRLWLWSGGTAQVAWKPLQCALHFNAVLITALSRRKRGASVWRVLLPGRAASNGGQLLSLSSPER